MKKQKLKLVNEQSSPLFRITSVLNHNNSSDRKFSNNICAFHIGKGYILSVAHNLKIKYKNPSTNEEKNFIDLYQQGEWKPFLVIQFRDNKFYKDDSVTSKINNNHIFYEDALARHTFLIELELLEAFYNEDFSLYKIVNTDKDIINKIPFVKPSYKILTAKNYNLFCLQPAPFNELGRMLNDAKIEGLLDSWGKNGDDILDGTRYLIKGYFRFGSSGAPYLVYNKITKQFRVNGIQSQASPIQLSINGNQNGNFQYINAIGSPLFNIKDKLKKYLTSR